MTYVGFIMRVVSKFRVMSVRFLLMCPAGRDCVHVCSNQARYTLIRKTAFHTGTGRGELPTEVDLMSYHFPFLLFTKLWCIYYDISSTNAYSMDLSVEYFRVLPICTSAIDIIQ